ncbi:MAG: hypothetical protein ACOYU4_04720 [Thermodesulfobacteriota bacterium]
MDTVIQHSGYEKVVEDRLRLGTVFFDELGYGIHSLSQGDYDPDMTTFIKLKLPAASCGESPYAR